MPYKRPCAPYCKVPEKRDFMGYAPEKSAEDFYKNYDPMVGVGTAGILLLFILLITVKSLARCLIRRWRTFQYKKSKAGNGSSPRSCITALNADNLSPAIQQQKTATINGGGRREQPKSMLKQKKSTLESDTMRPKESKVVLMDNGRLDNGGVV